MENAIGIMSFASSIAFILICSSAKRKTTLQRVSNTTRNCAKCKKKLSVMNSAIVIQGKDAMMGLLSRALHATSPLSDTDLFAEWALNTILSKGQSSIPNEFQKRQTLLEIYYMHEEEISVANKNENFSRLAWHSHPNFQIHTDLTLQLAATQRTLQKMINQLQVRHKKENKLVTLRKLIQDKEELLSSIGEQLASMDCVPELQAWKQAKKSQEQLLYNLGITTAQKELKKMQYTTGVLKGKGGFRFEDEAAVVVQEKLLGRVAGEHDVAVEDLVVVRNVTFQMASFEGSPGEIDMLVCARIGAGRDKADENCDQSKELGEGKSGRKFFDVAVLAVIEVKKNGSDIGKSFLSYQNTLNWLCGLEDKYDARTWRCKHYPKGHFVKPYVHALPPGRAKVVQESLVFTRKSFERIRDRRMTLRLPSSSGYGRSGIGNEMEKFVCSDLFYITRMASLDNISSKDMHTLMFRLANHKEIFKTRKLLEAAEAQAVSTGQAESKVFKEELRRHLEELRRDIISNSKFQSSFCTSDLLRVLAEGECWDQLFCVNERK